MGADYSIELISIETYAPQFIGNNKIFEGIVYFMLRYLLIQSLVLVGIFVSLFIKPVHKRRCHKIGDF